MNYSIKGNPSRSLVGTAWGFFIGLGSVALFSMIVKELQTAGISDAKAARLEMADKGWSNLIRFVQEKNLSLIITIRTKYLEKVSEKFGFIQKLCTCLKSTFRLKPDSSTKRISPKRGSLFYLLSKKLDENSESK